MSIAIKKLDISNILYVITFALLIMILPTAFLHEKTSRVLFYWCGYLSLIGVAVNLFTKQKSTANKGISYLFILLALLFFIWSILSFYISGDTKSELLYTPAKRWFIASVIAYYILNYRSKTSPQYMRSLILISMSIAFIAGSAYGIIQGVISSERIVLGINRATLTAYAYSAFTLAFSSLIAHNFKHNYKYLAQVSILLISTYVIFLTQTRSAMFIHPLLGLTLLVVCMYKDRLLNVKVVAISLIALITVIFLNNKILINRFNETTMEIAAYNSGNDNTSLGSRFSMWKLGLFSFKEYPFGQSESHRNNVITDYLKEHKENSAATEYLKVHLHNEFIQYASIFGIFGVIVLFIFFTTLIFKISQPKIIGPVGIATLSVLLYGSTDVLLTSIELIVIFSITITLSYMITSARPANGLEN